MTEAEAAPVSVSSTIPFINGTGTINLGPANGSALTRLANYVQALINSGEEIPQSPLCEWIADRVTGKDRQDLVFFLEGRRGSGKSYSCLYLGKRIAEAIARRKGGEWKNYFGLQNIATLEDNERVLELLKNTGKYQVVLIDDAALAISNRSWNSQENRNFNALLSICRTRRWVLMFTAVLKKHTDNQTREMCDLTGTVYKSFHKGGFNILKILGSEISGSGKEYRKRMTFSGKKIDFWVTLMPDPELRHAYDKQRDESAVAVNTRIVETGSFAKPRKKKEREPSYKERVRADVIKQYYDPVIDRYTKVLKEGGKPNLLGISREVGITRDWLNVILAEHARRKNAR